MRKQKIEILYPTNGSRVRQREIVSGLCSPTEVPYVLVLCEDQNWHLQDALSSSEGRWEVECQFGGPVEPGGQEYQIVAISGITFYASAVLADLPEGGSRSEIVTVYR